jgi:GNAT superfamily N-acetyltransferase
MKGNRAMPQELTIVTAASDLDLNHIKDLFREYFSWVQDDLHFDLSYQAIEKELLTLPGAYASPQGCLLLAFSERMPAGCVALRPHTAEICELKRMYVRPAFRGLNIGRSLCAEIVETARLRGYSLMRLDSEVSLKTAQKIYSDFGFHPAQPYYEVPESLRERTIFMELNLT